LAAIEIRNAILYSDLKYIENEKSGMKIYKGRVPDVQNPGLFTRVLVLVRDEDEAFLESMH
jgi:hypothetical protein